MEQQNIYENCKNLRNAAENHPQRCQQDDRKAGKWSERRYLVITTVFLGILCLLLLMGIVIQHFKISMEREKLNLRNNLNGQNLKSQNRFLKEKLANASSQGMIFMSPEALNWSDSRQHCRNHGADLIIIKSEEKQRKVSSLIQERIWIGLTDMEKEGEMKWVDDSPLVQGFWKENEPNSHMGTDEDCVEMLYPRVKDNWNDAPCSDLKKGLCE